MRFLEKHAHQNQQYMKICICSLFLFDCRLYHSSIIVCQDQNICHCIFLLAKSTTNMALLTSSSPWGQPMC
jgi:hypothetical protein